jgi:hypothetical protein
MKSARARFVLLATWVSFSLLPACGGSQTSARDTASAEIASLQARLQGTWGLTTFRPAVPLEPMLQAFLAAQFNVLTLRIGNGILSAESPTLHYSEPYQLRDVAGNRFRIVTMGRSDVTYASDCVMSPDGSEITFVGLIEPWRGEGVLRRR